MSCQYINGHYVQYFYESGNYLVDGRKTCYSFSDLARAVGLSQLELSEVLYI